MKFYIEYTLPDLTKMSVIFNGSLQQAITRLYTIDTDTIMEDDEPARTYDLLVDVQGKKKFLLQFSRVVPEDDLTGNIITSSINAANLIKDTFKLFNVKGTLTPQNIRFDKDFIKHNFQFKATTKIDIDNIIENFNAVMSIDVLREKEYSWMRKFIPHDGMITKIGKGTNGQTFNILIHFSIK